MFFKKKKEFTPSQQLQNTANNEFNYVLKVFSFFSKNETLEYSDIQSLEAIHLFWIHSCIFYLILQKFIYATCLHGMFINFYVV